MPENQPRELAVVTGASSGIGLELAKLFAADGFDVIVAAEDEAIDAAAKEIGAAGRGAVITPVRADLATDEGVHAVFGRIEAEHRPVAALALNAGRGEGGAFVRGSHESGHYSDLENELETIDLNCRSVVHLAKHVLPGMVAAGSGRVLFTSSVASTAPGAFHAVYNASKSFVQAFAIALREELKDSGVTITSLMPGPVDTDFFEKAHMLDTKIGQRPKDDPADVARDGYAAMMAGDERVVSHKLLTKVQGIGSRVVPDSLKAKMHRDQAEPGSGD